MMKSTRLKSTAALAAVVCAFGAVPAAHAEGWSFSAGADFTSGDYGTGQDTDIWIVPFSAAYAGDAWSFSITVPYIDIEGAPGVVPGAAGPASGGPLSAITNPLLGEGASAAPAAAPPIDEQGLGDITLQASITPYLSAGGTRLSFSGAARLPTGDEDRSLGAGQTVLSLSGGLAQSIGERSAVYVAAGYSSALEDGGDAVFAGAGLEGYVSRSVLIGASAEWSQARIADAPERTQATLYSSLDLNERVRIAAYVLAGLSEAAPDAGAGLRLVLR